MAVQSQTFPGDYLDINDQKQFFSIYGSAAFDGNNTLQRVPKDSGTSTIFASAFWVGAKNSAGDTFTAVDRFHIEVDWWPGPIMTGMTEYNAEASKYDRVWKINASDISYQLSHYYPLHYGTGGTDPDSLWTEITVGNPQGDRRMFGSTGPAVLPASGSQPLTVAFSFYQELMIGDNAQLLMQQGVGHLHDIYNAGSFECGSFALGTESIQEKTQSALLYPNPVGDKIFTGEKFNSVTVYNIAGEVVMQVENSPASIDVSQLPDGLYIFSAEQGQGRTVQRIVVQR